MSGYGRARPRRRDPIPVYRGPDDEAHAERLAARAKILAPALGYCGSCGVNVNEATGKLHDWECPDVAPERRVNGGNKP